MHCSIQRLAAQRVACRSVPSPQAAQDLQRCPDVIADYGLGEPPLALCRQALDVLLQAQPLTESAAEGAGSMPEREDRQARRQAVAEARSQLAVEDRREHGKKSRNERRQVCPQHRGCCWTRLVLRPVPR